MSSVGQITLEDNTQRGLIICSGRYWKSTGVSDTHSLGLNSILACFVVIVIG